jgi:hypothetical protein
LFSVTSSPHAVVDDGGQQHSDLCRKVDVPARLKWEIRDKLDQGNITGDVPGLTAWLKRHYSPADQAQENLADRERNMSLFGGNTGVG